MKRLWIGSLALAGIVFTAAPAFAATAYPIGPTNLRSGPGLAYATVGTMLDGQRATVLGHEGDWMKVQTTGGKVGYLANWLAREVFDDVPAYARVNAPDGLNLRATPAAAGALLATLLEGEELRLLEGLAGWYKVDAGVAGTGWVKAEFTERIEAPAAPVAPPPAPPAPPVTPQPVPEPLPTLAKEVVASVATALRVGRDLEYDRVAQVRAWERLTYVDSAEGWFKVQNSAGSLGWVDGRQAMVHDVELAFARKALYAVKEHDWSIQFLRVREVVPGGSGLVLREAPSVTAAALGSLHEGNQVKLLEVPGGEYVKVMLADGTTGWISRNWIKPVASPTESARLTRTAPGVLRLEVTGHAAAAGVTASGSSLRVPLPANEARTAALQVREHGVTAMVMDEQGLALQFGQSFAHQVVEQTAERLVVEFRPVIRQVEALQGADRQTYRLLLDGTAAPVARREGGLVMLDLPGARFAAGVTLPGQVRSTADAGGITLQVADGRPFAIKRGAGHVDLVFFGPGLSGKTVVLDPGHGGIESGAVGATGLLEKELNLAISLKLKAMLETAGAKVVMTRSTDTRCATPAELASVAAMEHLRYDLNCRTVVPNTKGADLYLSIHSNANPSRYEQGTETYWAAQNLNAQQSQRFATLVQREMVGTLATRDRGVKEEMFYVITFTDAPAALAEVAFVSNPWEESLLKQDSFRQKTAESLFRAISQFFSP